MSQRQKTMKLLEKSLDRLSLSYTCFNLLFLFLSYCCFNAFQKIANANTFLVAMVTMQMSFFISFHIMIQYYQSLFPFLSRQGAILLHFTIHYLPLFWTRLDFQMKDSVIAWVMFLSWYLLVRQYIKNIYTNKIRTEEYDHIITSASILYFGLTIIFSLCSCEHV